VTTEAPRAVDADADVGKTDDERRRLVADEPVRAGGVPIDVRRVPRKPDDHLRLITLACLVGIVLAGLLSVLVGLANDWFADDFAKTLIQTVVSPVLGALAAVVGYLFAERKH
jgi:hypothetical protein